jgi:hypothetical protein
MRPKRVVRAMGVCFLILLAGCYNISLFSDDDPSIDRSRYVTYSWSSTGEANDQGDDVLQNPFFYSRVRTAVDRELTARGYELKHSGPVDFIVDVHGRTLLINDWYNDSFFSPRHYYRDRWIHYDPWWGVGSPQFYARTYEECTLVIDITDAGRHQIAWRGAFRGVTRELADNTQMQEDIDRAVSKIIERFSPLKKGK